MGCLCLCVLGYLGCRGCGPVSFGLMLGCLWVVCGFRDLWLRYSFSQAVIVGWIVLVCVLGCWVCVLWWLVGSGGLFACGFVGAG